MNRWHPQLGDVLGSVTAQRDPQGTPPPQEGGLEILGRAGGGEGSVGGYHPKSREGLMY